MTPQPLSKLRILITRDKFQAGSIRKLLARKGARVVAIPTIEIRPFPFDSQVRLLLRKIQAYDWLVFSSTNAVSLFNSYFNKAGGDRRLLRKVKIACVGKATAKALKSAGFKAEVVPKDFKQEGLVNAFRKIPLNHTKWLVCGAKEGRNVLRKFLERKGAKVTVWTLYENRIPRGTKQKLWRLFERSSGVDLLTFMSPSAADHFYSLFTPAQHRKWLAEIPAAVIGPVTGASVKKWGATVAVDPQSYTMSALVDGIVKWARKQKAH